MIFSPHGRAATEAEKQCETRAHGFSDRAPLKRKLKKMSTKGSLITDSEKSTSRWIYGCSFGCALFSGIYGRVSPGLAGVIIYLGLLGIMIVVQKRHDKSLFKTVCCTLGIGFVFIPSTRLLGVALRQIGEVSFFLDGISQTVIIFFMLLGASSMILSVFGKQTAVEENRRSHGL
jgi:hypothetical protein